MLRTLKMFRTKSHAMKKIYAKFCKYKLRVTTINTYSLHTYVFLIFVVENILCVLFS